MRFIGLDLALTTQHKAVVMDEQGRSLSPILLVKTSAQSLERLFDLAREGAEQEPLVVVMEPTGMVWFPIAVFCQRHGVKVFLVNGQQVADLRRYYQKHAKSDRIDARVLAKLPLVSPEKLHPLQLAESAHLVCQRGCKELDRLSVLATAIQNRVRAIDRFAWPGLEQVLPDLIAPFTRWFREQWYDPRRVVTVGTEGLQHAWEETAPKTAHFPADLKPFRALIYLAEEVLALYGADSTFLDYAALQAEVLREQALLAWVETTHHELQRRTVRPLYRQFHPSRNLETLYGVGQDGAAVYVSFIGDPKRFPGHADFRGWTGMIPRPDGSQ